MSHRGWASRHAQRYTAVPAAKCLPVPDAVPMDVAVSCVVQGATRRRGKPGSFGVWRPPRTSSGGREMAFRPILSRNGRNVTVAPTQEPRHDQPRGGAGPHSPKTPGHELRELRPPHGRALPGGVRLDRGGALELAELRAVRVDLLALRCVSRPCQDAVRRAAKEHPVLDEGYFRLCDGSTARGRTASPRTSWGNGSRSAGTAVKR